MDSCENAARRRLCVGTVAYAVGRPLDCGLEHEPEIELTRDVPAGLVAKLRTGELDVALSSSIELFREPGYRYLADYAVAGRGFVGSVQVFLRRPLEDVRTLVLDPASRTAAALVQVLFRELHDRGRHFRSGAVPRFVEIARGGDPRQVDADARLAIGDAALREYLSLGAPDVFNPSAHWAELTGLPFVFAAWIVRPGVELTRAHLDAFARARRRGGERLDALADDAAREWRISPTACRKYLREECLYEPGSELEPALFEFRDRAAALDLCRGDLAPAAIPCAFEHVA